MTNLAKCLHKHDGQGGMSLERRSHDEGGAGENERQKDENDGEPELGLERVREERHPLLGEEDLGNKEPHARRGRQLSRTQQV